MKRFIIHWSMPKLRGSPSGDFTADAEQFPHAYSMMIAELTDAYSPLILFAELQTEVVSAVELSPDDELERLARRFWQVFHENNSAWMREYPYHELFAKATPYDDLGEHYQGALKAAVADLLKEKIS